MKTIQKITLSLLAVVGVSSLAASENINLNVPLGSAEVSGNLIASNVYKRGAGLAVMTGNNSGLNNLEIDAGNVQIATQAAAMPGAVVYSRADGASAYLEVAVAGVSVPQLTLTTPGELRCTDDAALVAPTLGASLLSVTAGALTVQNDLTAGSAPMDIVAGASMKVGGAGNKAPAANKAIHGVLEILANAVAASVPGATSVAANGKVLVDANVSVPAVGAGDFFSTGGLTFVSGSELELGDGAVWARAITVGSAN